MKYLLPPPHTYTHTLLINSTIIIAARGDVLSMKIYLMTYYKYVLLYSRPSASFTTFDYTHFANLKFRRFYYWCWLATIIYSLSYCNWYGVYVRAHVSGAVIKRGVHIRLLLTDKYVLCHQFWTFMILTNKSNNSGNCNHTKDPCER